MDSTEIALWAAEKVGSSSSANFFPPDKKDEVQRWAHTYRNMLAVQMTRFSAHACRLGGGCRGCVMSSGIVICLHDYWPSSSWSLQAQYNYRHITAQTRAARSQPEAHEVHSEST
jgi:hypothetical protein